VSRSRGRSDLAADRDLPGQVELRRRELGARFPRIALLLFEVPDAERLLALLARIPAPLRSCLDQVLVVQAAAEPALPPVSALARTSGLPLALHRIPRDYGYAGTRKAAFEHALREGFDLAITMRGDGRHPPELLPELVHAALQGPRRLVLAARVHAWRRRPAGLPLARLLAHRLATGFQNRALGLRLSDYHSSFRLYPVSALRQIPFQLDENARCFETQILIQCRALGLPLCEVPVPPGWEEYPSGRAGLREVVRACAEAVDYRLHQLHLVRRGRYFVERGIPYTLKRSPTGSHMQIVAAIRPGSRVLDLGCSQGLLARPLREKGASVTGVDARPPAEVAEELELYFQRDLEGPLDLPVGREFDYVVVSDVIEHLRNRVQLLRGARRFLKPGGRLLISTPNVALWFYRLSLLVGRFEYGPRGVLDQTHVRLFTRATFRREVERAGFHVLRERVTALPFEVVFESTGRSRLVAAVARAYHGLARAWPALFAYQHLLEAEITTLDEESTERGPERVS
jgi:2-polyprenyl-3-methyl-5-hydroxy-6-metoxy-1,4-benzoquinol methylase